MEQRWSRRYGEVTFAKYGKLHHLAEDTRFRIVPASPTPYRPPVRRNCVISKRMRNGEPVTCNISLRRDILPPRTRRKLDS